MADLSSLFAMQARKPTMAELLMKQGIDTSPTPSAGAAIGRALMGGLAGYFEKQDADTEGKSFDTMMGLTPGAPPVSPQPTPQGPNPQALGAALMGDQSQPRGIRNNNPLNIEAGSFTQGQPGFSGSDGRFAKFEQPQQGVDAAGKLLDTYQSKYGLNTVRGIINRWAPPGENNSQAYVASVAGRMGVDPDQPLGPEQRPALISAMGQFENGKPIQTAQADPAALPPNATPTQGFAVPGQPSQPQGPMQRQAPQVPPDVLARARQMWTSGDPTQKAAAMSLVQPYMAPKDQTRSLTTPEERAKAGIPATDQRPYQMDTVTGKVSSIDNSPTITMQANTTGETEYSKGKAADALGLERSADKTMMERQKLEVFKSLVSDFKTGKLAPAQSTMGAWGDAIGISPETMSKLGIPPNAAVNGQLIESMSNELTLGMIGTKGGEGGAMPANNFSDADRKFLQNTVPGLARMQGGNMVLAEIKQRSLDRQLDKISMWDEYRSQGKKFEDFERDWRAKVRSEPSLFADVPDLVRGLSNQPNASGFAPAGNAPQKGADSQEGQTATNPQTGQKVIRKGGQWVPFQ